MAAVKLAVHVSQLVDKYNRKSTLLSMFLWPNYKMGLRDYVLYNASYHNYNIGTHPKHIFELILAEEDVCKAVIWSVVTQQSKYAYEYALGLLFQFFTSVSFEYEPSF